VIDKFFRYRYIPPSFNPNVRIISLLSFATGTLLLASFFGMVLQGSQQSAYAVEKVDTIKVSPRPIHVTLPGGQEVTVFHLFVVYTQKQQQQNQEEPTAKDFVCQGFPLDPATGQIPNDSDLPLNLPSPYLLQGRCVPFDESNRDYQFRNLPSTTVVSGDNAKDVYRCFVKITERFNDAKIPYALLATNSNSYARAILDNCHVPGGDSRLPPGVIPQLAPGWSLGAGLP
jgi:hypothetical protein